MKANELTVGDFVTFRDCLEEDRIIPIRITALRDCDNHFLAQIDGDDISDELEFDDEIVGIPLTPEILEKNGFEGKEQGHYYRYSFGCSDNPIYIHHQNDKVACSTTDNRNELALFGMIVLTNIHELQHALRLCGIEKEIEL